VSSAVRLTLAVPSPRADSETRSGRQTRAHERDDRDVMGPSHPSEDQHIRARARLPSPSAFRLTGPALQIHFVCNPSTGACAAKLRALLFEVSLQAGRPPQRPVPPQVENPAEWPPMAACAGCEKEETATTLTRACAGCGVSRCVVLSLLLPVAHGRRTEDRYCRCAVIAAGKSALKFGVPSSRSARSVRLVIGANTRLSAKRPRPSSTSVAGNEFIALSRPCMLHLALLRLWYSLQVRRYRELAELCNAYPEESAADRCELPHPDAVQSHRKLVKDINVISDIPATTSTKSTRTQLSRRARAQSVPGPSSSAR
jgi:hypothetical protein